MAHAYSDTDLRYSFMERSNYNLPDIESRASSRHQPPPARFNRAENRDRFRDRHTVERERPVGKSSRYDDEPPQHKYNTTGRINKEVSQTPKARRNSRSMGVRSQSLDRKARKETPDVDFDRESPADSNVLCNKYAIDEMQRGTNRGGAGRHSNRDRFQNRIRQNHNRSQSVPRPVTVAGNQLELPSPSPPRRTQSTYSQYNDFAEEEEEHPHRHPNNRHREQDDMEMQPMRKAPRRKQRDGKCAINVIMVKTKGRDQRAVPFNVFALTYLQPIFLRPVSCHRWASKRTDKPATRTCRCTTIIPTSMTSRRAPDLFQYGCACSWSSATSSRAPSYSIRGNSGRS